MKKSKLVTSEGLAAFVRGKYDTAKTAKGDEFKRLQECVDLVKGEKIAELDAGLECGIVGNIASPIARGITGMLRDIYGQNTDTPFVLEPTPVVDLPTDIQSALTANLAELLPQLAQTIPPDQLKDTLQSMIGNMQNSLRVQEDNKAKQAAEELTRSVRDKLIEGGWKKAFEQDALQNFVMFPTLIVKCPVYKNVKTRKWDGSKYGVTTETIETIETISPFNFYPSPDALDAQLAEYVIEKRRMTNSELRSLSIDNGYDVEGVDKVREEYPKGYIEAYENAASSIQGTTTAEDNSLTEPNMMYDTLGYFGRVPGNTLATLGVPDVDREAVYEAEVWIIGKWVIKAMVNPDPLGRRPFYSASFEPIPNTFWGECPMTRIVEHQRACTSTLAHMFRNMSFASGPLIERDVARLETDDVDTDLSPYSVIDIKTHPSGGAASVHNYKESTSHAAELMSVFDKFKAEAYEATGVPKALFGGADGMGTIGRTSGGIATVYAQGSKTIKHAMKVLEDNIIEPVIQRIVDIVLDSGQNPNARGDIKVRARGVSGIVDKENKREQLNWAIQSLVPLMSIKDDTGASIIPAAAPIRLLQEQFKSMGIPTEGIFKEDYAVSNAAQQDVQAVGTAPTIVPQPALDGRSPDAVAAIDSMGGVGP